MKGRVMGKPAGAAIARAAIAGAIVFFLLGVPAASGAVPYQDDIVPEGVWKWEVSLFLENRTEAFNRFMKLRSLKQYLIPDRDTQALVTGKISRNLIRTDLRFTYGIDDGWNLFLEIPYLQLTQRSDLATDSVDPVIEAQVASLQSQTLSGLGDIRMYSLHRPVFTDRNGFVWGWGFSHPMRSRDESEDGALALALRRPNGNLLAFLHYTRYLASARSRFDARVEGFGGMRGHIKSAEGKRVSYGGGNGFDAQLGWHREFGRAGAGIEIMHHRRAQSRIDGGRQADPVEETLVRLRFGYGNLTYLEEGPMPLPYQLTIEMDRSMRGFNVPYSNGLTLSWQFYF